MKPWEYWLPYIILALWVLVALSLRSRRRFNIRRANDQRIRQALGRQDEYYRPF